MTERRARRRPGENRTRLLEAGIIVFGMYGFHGASTSDIARLAEVPQPHVYQHFSSKSALFLSCVEVAVARLTTESMQADASSGTSATRHTGVHLGSWPNSGAHHTDTSHTDTPQTGVRHTGVHTTHDDLLRLHLQAITLTADTHHPVDGVSSHLAALRDALTRDQWEEIILAAARLFTRDPARPPGLT